MRTVEIKREDVLKTLRTNRVKHEETQGKALKVWAQKLQERLQDTLQALAKGQTPKDVYDMVSDIERPTDVLQAYDDAIAMLEMDVRATITLTADEFKCYVQDRWDWKRDWLTSNSKYIGS